MSMFDKIMGPLFGGGNSSGASDASGAQPQSTRQKILTGILTTGLGGVRPQKPVVPAVTPSTLPRPAGPPPMPNYTPVPQGFNPWQDPLAAGGLQPMPTSNLDTAANMNDLLGVNLNGYLTGGKS